MYRYFRFRSQPSLLCICSCNGAFKITDYEPSAMMIKVEKNDDYYDAGAVKLDGVEWQVILDNQTAAMSYESGDLELVTEDSDSAQQVAQLRWIQKQDGMH